MTSELHPGQGPAEAPLFTVGAPMADPQGPRSLRAVARVYLRHLSTRIILAGLFPLVGWRLWVGGWGVPDLGIAVVTLAAWPFFEWVFHVVMHARPRRLGPLTLDTHVAREHRLHHSDPTLVDHTLLPPRELMVMGVLSIAGFIAWLGPAHGATAAICFHVGGLVNGWTHLLTHMPYPPRSRFYRWIKRTHLLHHFKNEHYWYAFTGPWVDVLLRTWKDPAGVETSPACQSATLPDTREGAGDEGPRDPSPP